ncbi:MAG: hypothetical protein ACTSU5_05320 [Promethearchaeota archaeon]
MRDPATHESTASAVEQALHQLPGGVNLTVFDVLGHLSNQSSFLRTYFLVKVDSPSNVEGSCLH